MNIRSNIQNILVFFFFAIVIIVPASCKFGQEYKLSKVEVGKGFLTILPLNIEDFFMMVNLGHLSPPGHIFPSDHGGFYLSDHMNPVPIFAPADMIITRIVKSEHINHGFTDYSLTLSVNDEEFLIVFGHISEINHTILEKTEGFDNIDCD